MKTAKQREYELMYLVRPDVADKRLDEIQAKVEEIIAEHGGVHHRSERWKKRRLAYEIQKYREGYYTVMRFAATPEVLREIDYYLRYNEDVLRYLLTRVDTDKRKMRLEKQRLKTKSKEE